MCVFLFLCFIFFYKHFCNLMSKSLQKNPKYKRYKQYKQKHVKIDNSLQKQKNISPQGPNLGGTALVPAPSILAPQTSKIKCVYYV